MSRVLVVDDQPPQPSRDGASQRMLTILELLIGLGHTVDFASARGWPPDLRAPLDRLTALGIHVAGRDGPPETLITHHASEYDVIMLSRLATATRLLDLVRQSAPGVHVVYDAMHIAHVSSYRRAKRTGSSALLRQSLIERTEELRVIGSVDAIIAVSAPEAALVREYGARAPIAVVTAAHVDAALDPPPRAERAGGLFVGYMRNLENELAVRRLVERVWPIVLQQVPGQPLHVVGAGSPEWLSSLAQRLKWLHVHDAVRELDPILRRTAVSVLPITGGGGIKTKTLQSFAFGIPVVGTADALRGIPAIDGEHALRAEADEDLAAAAVRVLEDVELWTRLSEAGRRLLEQRFGRETARAGLKAALCSAAGETDPL